MIEIGSAGWVRARKSEHVGSSTCCNLRLKQGETFERYACNNVYSHGNICNIQIKRLQHTYEADEIFRTYTCNIRV
jgi:hypothetical protein